MRAAATIVLLLAAAGHMPGSGFTVAVFSENSECADGVYKNFVCVESIFCKKFNLTDLKAAKNSICGFEGNKSKVCCKPEDVIDRSTNPTSSPALSPMPLQTNKQQISAKCKHWNENIKKTTDTISKGLTYQQKEKLTYVIYSNWLECHRNPEDRIYGGEILRIYEHPWLAIIYQSIRGKEQLLCGGSLIFSRYVITAAHCVAGVNTARNISKVRFGEWDLDSDEDCQDDRCNAPPVDVAVESIIVHPGYRNTSVDQAHDIAILKLARAVNYTESVMPVCLPLPKWPSAEYYIASGWGQTEFVPYSMVKRQVRLRNVGPDVCRVSYPRVNLTNVICAGGRRGEDTCRGDSGSSLVADMKEGTLFLMGVTSVGSPKCGAAGVPSIYTRVSSYMNWIADNIDIPMCDTT